MSRVKVSASYNDFVKSIDSLLRLDKDNQIRFTSSNWLSKKQFDMLTEGVYFSAFRAYETFIEEIFLLYALGKPAILGNKPKTYLSPRDYNHAFELIQSSMPYLEWNNPDNVIKRAETYLKDGEPIKLAIAANRVILQDMRRIRNHIAHDSKESLSQYKKVIQRHYGTMPLKVPRPGEYLVMMVPRMVPSVHYLLYYLEKLKIIAKDISH